MLFTGASAVNAQQYSPSPRSGSSGGSYPAAYGDYSQPSSRLTSPYGQQQQQQAQAQQPAYAALPSSNQQYGGYPGYGSAAAAPALGSSNSGALSGGWGWPTNAGSDAGSNSIIGSYNGTGTTSGQHGRYSMQMQQMMAQQQQQQQQQMYVTSGIGSCNSSANMRPALNAMDSGSRDGSMQYDLQQGACWSPRGGSVAGNAFDAAGAAGGSSGYAATQSNWQQGYGANAVPGSLEAASVGRGKRDAYTPTPTGTAAAGYGSSVPKAVGMAAFCSSKGAFGGKTIVQPPGGHFSLQALPFGLHYLLG
jgi:hypothetical protein